MLAQTLADHHLHGPVQRHWIVIPARQGLGGRFAVNGYDIAMATPSQAVVSNC